MSAARYTVAYLACDADWCDEEFGCGEELISKTRNEAETRVAWHCNAETDTDLCPEHAPKGEDGTP